MLTQKHDFCLGSYFPYASRGFQAVHLRHSNVQHNNVGLNFFRFADCLDSVGNVASHFDVGVGTKQCANTASHGFMIIDDEYPNFRHAGAPHQASNITDQLLSTEYRGYGNFRGAVFLGVPIKQSWSRRKVGPPQIAGMEVE
jgi:hypothetical protein